MSDWSRIEVAAAVADYLAMLLLERRGQPFNKAEHNRRLVQLLSGRTRAAVERKHQNISAIWIELGYPYIGGYKPLGNYQELLREVVEERLRSEGPLEEEIASFVVSPPALPAPLSNILDMAVPVPTPAAKLALVFTSHRVLGRGCRNGITLKWKRETERSGWLENNWC